MKYCEFRKMYQLSKIENNLCIQNIITILQYCKYLGLELVYGVLRAQYYLSVINKDEDTEEVQSYAI